MKILLIAVFFCGIIYSAQANSAVDDTQTPAGEQTSNLYRLNTGTAVQLKKLQQLDKILAKNPNIMITDSEDVADLLNDKKQVNIDEQEQLMRMYQEIVKRTTSKKSLIVDNSKNYQQISHVIRTSIKDSANIAELKLKIRRP